MARYINSVPQYLDGAGDPIINGKLKFYKSGTTTPIDTFADAALTTKNASPVSLDAAGRVPNIFFDGAARAVCTYDDLLTGEDGKQLFDKDPASAESGFNPFDLWGSQVIYSQYDIARGSDGEYYQSLSNENQGDDPTLTPTKWMQVRFIELWNANVAYFSGDIVQTSGGSLWKSLQEQSGNNPDVATSPNWAPAIDSDLILSPTNTAVALVGGGNIIKNRVNELQDGGAYVLPSATSTDANQFLIVTQPLEFAANKPTVSITGGDTITTDLGADTSIIFDGSNSIDIRLTSDGASQWRLTV